MARRKKQAEDLGPDAFQAEGGRWVGWFEKNGVLVVAGLGVVLLGIVGFEFLGSSSNRAASEVTSAFDDALERYREVTAPGFARTATSTRVLQEAYAEAQDELSSFRDAHAGNGATRLALVYEADLASKREDYEAAARLYTEYVQAAPADDPLLFVALEGAGYAYESLEKYDEAVQTFEALAKVEYAEAYAHKHIARVKEAKGDLEGAKQSLERLLDSEPTPFLENFAKNHLKLLSAR
ncbi:MAG: tetratricopeptide repeat protein [Myxococcota bacterium]